MNQKLETSVESKIHEDLSPTRNLTGLHLKIVAAIAIIWSLFQLWYASPFPFWFNIGLFKGLRAVFSVHNEPFQIWASAKSGITNFDGLKGKVVNIGNPGSGQRGTMEELMKAMGVDNSFFKSVTELTSSEQVKALCDGKIDAYGYSVGFPNGAMEQAATCAAKARPINLTGGPVQGLIDGADYYAKAVIPAGTYTGQTSDATTFGVKATVVTSNAVEADLVYLVVKAVFENFDDFRKQHPAFAPLKKEDMIADGLSAPLHEGAVRYYKEVGLM